MRLSETHNPTLIVVDIMGSTIFYSFDKVYLRDQDWDEMDISLWQRLVDVGDLRPVLNGIDRAKKILSRKEK